jgi:hypothetical protein
VAKSAAGKWVSRVGASGGGKSYQKTRPVNYYGALAVIVVLGLIATVFARYEYQNPPSAAASTPPAIGTTWYAALSIEACGKTLPFLAPNPKSAGGLTVLAANVIKVSPVSAADAGSHATLGQFAAEYPGLIASSNELAVPTSSGSASTTTTYHNGDTCSPTSKYPGQKGQISYAYWTTFGQKKPVVTTNPSSIKLTQFLRVTMAFDPQGVTPKAPQQATINAMVKANATATTTTTAPASVVTTVPSTPTTTMAPQTTTTTKATTTSAPKG